MPLEVGRSWSYSVRNGFQTYIEPIKVEGRTPVGGANGFVLSGPMGTSAVAWEGERLVASRLANSAFTPPVPIALADLPARGATLTREWSGTIEAFGVRRSARGVLRQSRDRLLVGGQRQVVARADLSLRLSDRTQIELSTYFRPGEGSLVQEQRTNRKLVVAIRRLDAE